VSIDLSEVVSDPEMAESFTILRSVGKFVAGGWQDDKTTIVAYGVVTVAKQQDIQMLPEADQVNSAMAFYSTTEMKKTYRDANNTLGTSDILLWRGDQYRVMHVAPYVTRGYWRAIATSMSGN
jgi:hypothetical protein